MRSAGFFSNNGEKPVFSKKTGFFPRVLHLDVRIGELLLDIVKTRRDYVTGLSHFTLDEPPPGDYNFSQLGKRF